jgi:hypothetical protein
VLRAALGRLAGLSGSLGPAGAVEAARRELARLGYDPETLTLAPDASDTVDFGGRRCWLVRAGVEGGARVLVDARRGTVLAAFLGK